MNDAIHYFFDPICGWCYGFSKQFNAFYQNHREEFRFEVYTGGMVPDARARPIGEMKEYLKEAYPRVEELSGVVFGKAFLSRLEDGSAIYGSDVPSKIFHSMASEMPDRKPELAGAIQELIYHDGIDVVSPAAYASLAERYKLDAEYIEQAIESEATREQYENDKYTTRQFGVKGFPFLVAELEGEYYLLAQGFRTLQDLESTLVRAKAYHVRPTGQ